MPIYINNNQRYNIPDEKAEAFEKAYPQAKVELYANNSKYNIPLSARKAFQDKFTDWSYTPALSTPHLPEGIGEVSPRDGGVNNTTPEEIIERGRMMYNPFADVPTAFRLQSTRPTIDPNIAKQLGNKAALTFKDIEPMPEASEVLQRNAETLAGLNAPTGLAKSPDPIQQAISQDIIGKAASQEWQRDTLNSVSGMRDEAKQKYLARIDQLQKQKQKVDYTKNSAYDIVSLPDSHTDHEANMYRLTYELLDEAQKHMETVRENQSRNGFQQAAAGVGDAIFDIDTLTLGLDSLSKNATLKAILDKADADQPLTQAEESLLNAALYKQFTEAALPNGRWYNVGKGIGEQVPYMLEFALSGGVAGALTKGASKAIGKQVVKYINNLALKNGSKIANRTARNVFTRGSRMLGNTLSQLPGGVMRAAVQVPLRSSVYNDIIERQIGTLGYSPSASNSEANTPPLPEGIGEVSRSDGGVNNRGGLQYTGRIDADNTADAITKGLTSGFITNLTESVGGEGIQFITNKIGGLMGKGANAVFKNLQSPRWYNRLREGLKRNGLAQFISASSLQGPVAESGEELLDQTLNAIFVGDSSLDPNSENYVFDLDNLIDTAITTGAISLFMGAAGGLASGKIHRDVNKAYALAEQNLRTLHYTDTEINALNNIATSRPQEASKWVSSITRTMRTLAIRSAKIENSLSPEARTLLAQPYTEAEFNELSPYDQQAVMALAEINNRFNDLTIQRDYVVAGINYNALSKGLKESVAPQAEAAMADIQANALRDSDYTVKVTFRGQDGYLVSGTADIDNLPDGRTVATLPAGNIYQVRTKSPDGQWIIQQAVAEDIVPGSVTPTQQLIDETTARIYTPVQNLITAEQAQAQAEVAQSTEQTSPIVEQTSPIVEQTSPIVEQTTASADTIDSNAPIAPNGSTQSTEAQPLSDEQFDEHIATLPAGDAIQAITQHRGVEEADQYATWRKGILTKERDKSQKTLNAKVKPFDASRYPDYAQMKREERKYNEALQATRSEALGNIERITAEIADIDRYLAIIDTMAGDYWDEIQEILQYEQEAYNDYDTNSTSTTPRITQQGAEITAIKSSTQPTQRTTITPNGTNATTSRPETPQTSRNSTTLADTQREGEQIYSNDRRGDSRHTSQWQDSISSQQELDENGHPFVISSNGTTTFGEITENSGLQPAPIKLSEGENTTDTRGDNHGYGLAHIEAGHGEQIRNAGFTSIEEFVESVAQNYDTIREGGVIANNQTYLLEISDEHNNTLFIQLSKDGSYWNVNSAGIFRKKYSRRKPEVFTRPALESENNTDFGAVNSGQSNGATTPAGNSPTTSTHKGTSSSSQSQEINEEINKQISEQATPSGLNAPTAPNGSTTDSYTITPTQYTTKRGNVLDMHLVKFNNELTKQQYNTAKQLAKADKGWYDREQGGFMMRSQESAQQLADTIASQPISMTDIKALNDGDIAFTEPQQSESKPHAPIWQYSIHVDTDGYTTLRRDDISGEIPIADDWGYSADSPQEMLDILRNPHNNLQEVLDAVGVILENKIKARELDRKIAKQRKQEYEALRANGVNGYKIGEKVIYKDKEATIHDFEQFGAHQPVLDTGMAPVIYEVAEWSDIKKPQQNQSASSQTGQDLTTGYSIDNDAETSAKVVISNQGAKHELNNIIHKYAGQRKTRGFISDLARALGDRSNEPRQTYYFEFTDKQGNPYTLRISNHNVNGENIADNEKEISIVIKSRRQPNKFIAGNADVREYVYFKESIANGDGQTLAWIAQDIATMLDTGVYEDNSGIAILNTSPTNPANQGQFGLVSDDRMAELKERLRRKLGGQMNIGIDPEILSIGLEIAVGHIDRGIKSFTDFARVMINDLGDTIRPYLKAFYNGARDLPEVIDNGLATDMTPYDEVQQFDVANFNQTNTNPIATAKTVAREAQVEQEVKTAKQRIKRSTEKKKSIPSSSNQLNLFDNTDNNNEDAREQDTRTNNSRTQPRREELPETESVEPRTPLQHTVEIGRSKRGNTRTSGNQLGDRPLYDVNKNYSNEEISQIVSSVTDIVDGRVVITAPITDDIRAICHQYKSGGVAKKGHGILDEYYTDGKIVDAVSMLITPYFNNSNAIRVLEPSVGVGNFISAVDNIPTSEIVTFEINPTTARIAKILYPGIDVNLRSFETEFIDDAGNKKPLPQKYNLIIGNPPYGSHRGLYKGLGEESKIARYEDYFVKRSLDVLNEGGVLAMVLPSSWIDRHTRYGGYTIEAAYRLPSGAFEATQVGTDIVILRKDRSIPIADHTPYFEQYPERVLGEVKQRKGRYGKMEDYVQGDIDTAIEAIKRDHAEQLANRLDIAPSNDNLNNIEDAIDETGSLDKATAIVQTAKDETNNPAPANNTTKKSKYKTELNRGAETVPTSQQFSHQFSEGEVEAFYDTEYDGTINHPSQHRKYANYIGGRAMHDFYYAEGDIYAKLDQLESEKENIIATYGQEQYDKQKRLLMSVLPKRKGLSEITISPNTTFVKNLYIDTDKGSITLRDAFIDFCSKLPYQAFGDSSSWEVRGYVNNEQVYGQDKERNALVRERRKRVANDLFVKFLNEELSQPAQTQVVAAFNREYNSTYRPDYSRVPMFSTINKDFRGKPLKLTSVQLAGIGRMTVKGVGVLAHEVGFGKTLSGILAMHEAMTRGFATKPLVVVPNDNILKQWVETIKEVLPQATVNTLGNLGTSYDLTDFKVNDGEFTLVTYEGLKAMSFSDDTYNRLAERFSYITEDLKKHQSERDIQKKIEKKLELKGKMKRGAKTSYGFEDFGFDWLTVDEVHNCNHIVSKVRLDKSVSSDFRSQNQRTSDLGLKTWLAAQYIQEENNGRNVLLLSATPFTNKPLEYYSILSLVGNKMLKRKGFFHVDQFFSTFMEADNELEIGANGRPTQKTNVRRFRNNGLFQQLLSEFIDIKGEEDNPELVRPDRHNKEYKINPNELTEDAMAAVQDLLNDNDTVLQGIGHARAAAFSPYATSLLGIRPKNHREFVKNSPKINTTIKLIEQNKKDRPDAGQIIYSEVGVEYFPMIRDYLVNESGFKPSEVRIITGATSNAERVNIQSAFNKGEVKVVIGSPAIKEGLNLQENTTDMYILSLPWNFTQLRQIEGRGWRQGNKWENIRINYMLTNNSVDVFMLQRLQLKQGLYNEAMKKGAETLDVSDIDTSELKTALITDPAVRAEIVIKQEREKLEQQRTQIEADLSFVLRKYESYNKLIEKLESKKKEINQFKEWAAGGDTYWADRLLGEENKLNAIVAEIQEEKERLQKKGVNVDDIVRQTEQSQNAIEDINQKIENLKEYQEELTDKYRREQELKQQQQGDLLTTYIKERKAENNNGSFYKIRPKDTQPSFRPINPGESLPENIKDRFSFRELDDNTNSSNTSNWSPEEQDIIDRAKANGTYLLAPNGQPTNLTPRQWAQVRTRAFKEWFGEWELLGKKKFLTTHKPVSSLTNNEFAVQQGVKLTDQVEQYFATIGNKATSPIYGDVILDRRGADDSLAHGMSRNKAIAYAAVKDVIETGILIDYNTNHKGRGYDSAVIAAPIEIAGERYICYTTIIRNKKENRYYLHEVWTQKNLTDVRSNAAQKQPSQLQGTAKILQNILAASDNASKIVDENGEPRVMYHGSNYRPLLADGTFKAFDGAFGKGIYFTSAFPEAADYAREKLDDYDLEEDEIYEDGYVTEAFLNIRNSDNIAWSNYGYGEIITWAENSNQIKSATDNIGTFDNRFNDIRFRTLSDAARQVAANDMPRRIEERTAQLAGKLGVPITVLHSNDDLRGRGEDFNILADWLDGNLDGRTHRMAGMFDAESNQLFIFAHNIAQMADPIAYLESTITHEVVAHYGLRQLLSDKGLTTLLGDTWSAMPQDLQIRWGKYAMNLKRTDTLSPKEMAMLYSDARIQRKAAEEYIAHLSESGVTEPTIWQRICASFRRIMRKLGIFSYSPTEADIRYILSQSYRNLTNRGKSHNTQVTTPIGINTLFRSIAADNRTADYALDTIEQVTADYADSLNAERIAIIDAITPAPDDSPSTVARKVMFRSIGRMVTKDNASMHLFDTLCNDVLANATRKNDKNALNAKRTSFEEKFTDNKVRVNQLLDKLQQGGGYIRPEDNYWYRENAHKASAQALSRLFKAKYESRLFEALAPIIRMLADNMNIPAPQKGFIQNVKRGVRSTTERLYETLYQLADYLPFDKLRDRLLKSINDKLDDLNHTDYGRLYLTASYYMQAVTALERQKVKQEGKIAEQQTIIEDAKILANSQLIDVDKRIEEVQKSAELTDEGKAAQIDRLRLEKVRIAQTLEDTITEANEAMDVINEADYGGLAGVQYAIFDLYGMINENVEAIKDDRQKLTVLAQELEIPTVEEFVKQVEDIIGSSQDANSSASQLWDAVRAISEYELETSYIAGLISRSGYQALTYNTDFDGLLKERYEQQKKAILDHPDSYDNIDKFDEEGNLKSTRRVLNDNARIALNKLNQEYAEAIDAIPMPGKNGSWAALVETGWLTQQEVDNIHRKYEHYLPLKGHAEMTAEDRNEYESHAPKNQSTIREAKGHTQLARDVITQIVQDALGTIQAAERNKALTLLYKTLTNNQDLAVAREQYKIQLTYYTLQRGKDGKMKQEVYNGIPTAEQLASGEVYTAQGRKQIANIDIPITNDQRDEHSVSVRVNGEDYTMFFYDKRIADAITGRNNNYPEHVILKTLSWLNKKMAAFITSLSPAFQLGSNMWRDIQEMFSNTIIDQGLLTALKALGNRFNQLIFGKINKAVYRYQIGKLTPETARTATEKLVVEYFVNGGPVNITQLPDYDTVKLNVRNDLLQYLTTGKMPSDNSWLSRIAERVELASRLSVYIASRNIGKSVNEAIINSKEATVNFDRKGTEASLWGSYIMFFNAIMQGVRRQVQLWRNHPARALATYGFISFSITPLSWMISHAFQQLICLITGDDDEPMSLDEMMKYYYSFSPEYRQRNFIIILGRDDSFRLPLALNYLPFSTIGDSFYRLLFDKNSRDDANDMALDVLSAFLETYTPVGQPLGFALDAIGADTPKEEKQAIKSAVGSALPPVFQPVAQNVFNYNFMGGQLYNEPFDENDNEPYYLNPKAHTQDIYINISQWLSNASGGDEAYAGDINLHPEEIENFFGLFGFFSEFTEQVLSVISMATDGEDNTLNDYWKSIPVLSRFTAGSPAVYKEKSLQGMFYTDKEELDRFNNIREAYIGTKKYDERVLQQYSPDEQRYFADLNTMQTIAKRIRKEIKADTPEGEAPKYHEDERLKAIYNLANEQFHSLASGEYKPIDDPYYTYMYIKDAIEKAPHRTTDGTYRLIDTKKDSPDRRGKLRKLLDMYSEANSAYIDLPTGYYPGMPLDSRQKQALNYFNKQVDAMSQAYNTIDFNTILTE